MSQNKQIIHGVPSDQLIPLPDQPEEHQVPQLELQSNWIQPEEMKQLFEHLPNLSRHISISEVLNQTLEWQTYRDQDILDAEAEQKNQ